MDLWTGWDRTDDSFNGCRMVWLSGWCDQHFGCTLGLVYFEVPPKRRQNSSVAQAANVSVPKPNSQHCELTILANSSPGKINWLVFRFYPFLVGHEGLLGESRGIALLLPVYLGTRWGWVVSTTPRPPFSWESPGTHCIGGWVVLGAGLDRCGKSRPHRDSIPFQPITSRYTDWAISAGKIN
jgi:hypothetical protein